MYGIDRSIFRRDMVSGFNHIKGKVAVPQQQCHVELGNCLAMAEQEMEGQRRAHVKVSDELAQYLGYKCQIRLSAEVGGMLLVRPAMLSTLSKILADSVTPCVQGELDELEREEFFRLKKVQNKKQQKESLPRQVSSHAQEGILHCHVACWARIRHSMYMMILHAGRGR